MIFNDSNPIYIQIAELITEKIANSEWIEEERIPSVRDLGGDLEVNPNTVMRSYEWLSEREIIYNKRGIGFFVSPKAKAIVLEQRRYQLLDKELREIARLMVQLDISTPDVVAHIEHYLAELKRGE